MTDPHAEQKERHAALLASALVLIYVDMREDVLIRLALGLLDRLFRQEWVDRVRVTAADHMERTAAEVAHDVAPDFDASRMDAYLATTAESFATTWGEGIDEMFAEILAQTKAEVQAAISEALTTTLNAVDSDANLLTRRAANFAAKDAAEASDHTTKTWHTSGSGDSRDSHAALNGMTIPIDERFPNGLRYPGAPGPPAEVINCQCYLSFGGGSEYPPEVPFKPGERPRGTEADWERILGKHRHGSTEPGKTTFPKGWSDADIQAAVDEAMASPDTVVRSGDKVTFDKTVRGTLVRAHVRVDGPKPVLWTAYPPRR